MPSSHPQPLTPVPLLLPSSPVPPQVRGRHNHGGAAQAVPTHPGRAGGRRRDVPVGPGGYSCGLECGRWAARAVHQWHNWCRFCSSPVLPSLPAASQAPLAADPSSQLHPEPTISAALRPWRLLLERLQNHFSTSRSFTPSPSSLQASSTSPVTDSSINCSNQLLHYSTPPIVAVPP